MKLIVIEDEIKTRQQLIQYIQMYNSTWSIQTECDAIEEALFAVEQHEYDLMITDIELTDGNMMNAIEKFPSSLPIIFVTAYDRYMQQAFDVNSIHYITKPIQKEKLFKALEKFEQLQQQHTSSENHHSIQKLLSFLEVQQSYQQKFLAQLRNRSILVDIKDILFFEIENGIVFIHTSKEKLMLKERSLDKIIHKLNPQWFMRINRHCIIHKEYVEEIKPYDKNAIMIKIAQKWLKSSQKQTVAFRKWITE